MLTHKCPQLKESIKQANSFGKVLFMIQQWNKKKRLTLRTKLNSKQNYMKYNRDINFFRAVLICLVILVHPNAKIAISAFIMPSFLIITGYLVHTRFCSIHIKNMATIHDSRNWLCYIIPVPPRSRWH